MKFLLSIDIITNMPIKNISTHVRNYPSLISNTRYKGYKVTSDRSFLKRLGFNCSDKDKTTKPEEDRPGTS